MLTQYTHTDMHIHITYTENPANYWEEIEVGQRMDLGESRGVQLLLP